MSCQKHPNTILILFILLIIGAASVIYIYDLLFTVEIKIKEEPKLTGTFSLENNLLKIILENFSDGEVKLIIADKTSKRTYCAIIFHPLRKVEVRDRNLTATFYWWLTRCNFTAILTLNDERPEMSVEVQMSSTVKMHPELVSLVFPPPLNSSSRDFIVLPYAEGVIFPSYDWRLHDTFPYFGYKVTMGWAGVTDLNKGYMIILDTPFDAGFKIESSYQSPYMSIAPVIYGQKGYFSYQRKFTYVFISEGGYISMAKRYREFAKEKGYVKTLREKSRENGNIDKLIGAVDLWVLNKELQTEEFFKELRAFGVDKAVISLEGSWRPLINFSKMVKFINSLGYLVGRYDIYTDVWNPADNPPEWARTEGFPDDVVVLWNGELCKGWVIKLGARRYQGYYLCSKTHCKVARERVSQDLALNNYTARFIDVETASQLWECYNPNHPTTREEDAQARVELLSLMKTFGLVVGSEEAREWAFTVTDYGEGTMTIKIAPEAGYDWMTPVNNPGKEYFELNVYGIYRVPLRSLVYHDVHVATWYTGDGATKVPDAWVKKDLLNILYGTMPLWMPINLEFWNKHRSLFLKSYQNVCTVFRQVGYDEMISHEFLTSDRKVQRTVFSSGVQIIVNFGDLEFHYNGWVLPKDGFLAIGEDWIAYRAFRENIIVNEVVTPWKSFLDSRGAPYRGFKLETNGAVLAERLNTTSIRIAFLDELGTYVSLNLLSFFGDLQEKTVKIYPAKDNGEIEINKFVNAGVSDGWIRFDRLSGVNIYYIRLLDIYANP
ncbi:MAG: glycoside hydrolase [Thermoproteota archaeon]